MAYSRSNGRGNSLYVLRSFPYMQCYHGDYSTKKGFCGTIDMMLEHLAEHYYNNDAPETDYDHILTRMANDIIEGKP